MNLMLRKKKDTLIQCLGEGRLLEFNVKKKERYFNSMFRKRKDT